LIFLLFSDRYRNRLQCSIIVWDRQDPKAVQYSDSEGVQYLKAQTWPFKRHFLRDTE